MGKPIRYWGIGFKGWVEIRSSPTQPRKIDSEDEVTSKERIRQYPVYPNPATVAAVATFYREYYDEPKYKMVVKKLKMSSTTFNGGKVMAVIRVERFRRLTKIGVGVGGMVELDQKMVELILNRAGN